MFDIWNRSEASFLTFLLPGWRLVLGCGSNFKRFAFVLVPIVAILFELLSTDLRAKVRSSIFTYCIGLSVAAAGYCLPFYWSGTLQEHFEFLRMFHQEYAFADPSLGEVPSPTLWLEQFFMTRGFYPIYIVAYGVAGFTLIRRGIQWLNPQSPRRDETILSFFSLYLIASVYTIQLGGRFYPHYFLFLLPAIAILFSIGICRMAHLPQTRSADLMFISMLAIFVADRFWRTPNESIARPIELVVFLVCVVMLIICWFTSIWRPGRFQVIRWVVLFVPMMEVIRLIMFAPMLSFVDEPDWRRPIAQAVSSKTKDRLFVWGWAPELYVESGLIPASQFVFCAFVVQDFVEGQKGRLNPVFANQLMQELEQSAPGVLIDASRVGQTRATPETYRIDRFPALSNFIDTRYEWKSRINGCDIYLRRS